jgi:hypothetical protein
MYAQVNSKISQGFFFTVNRREDPYCEFIELKQKGVCTRKNRTEHKETMEKISLAMTKYFGMWQASL